MKNEGKIYEENNEVNDHVLVKEALALVYRSDGGRVEVLEIF